MLVRKSEKNQLSTTGLHSTEEVCLVPTECADDAVAVLHGEIIAGCNDPAAALIGRPVEEIVGKAPWEVFTGRVIGGGSSGLLGPSQIEKAYQQGSARFNCHYLAADGAAVILDISLTRIDFPEIKRLVVVLNDVTDRTIGDQKLLEHIAFQTRLSTISNALVTAGDEDIDAKIWQALQEIGDTYLLDRIRLWWDNQQTETAFCSHEWNRDGQLNKGTTIPVSNLRWSHNRLRSGRCYSFATIDELPADALEERAYCEAEGVRSLFGAPVIVDDEIVGSVAFVTFGETRNWSQGEMTELRLLGQVLASGLQRSEHARKIQEQGADLLRSQYVARIGIFSVTARPGKSLVDEIGKLTMSVQACEIFGIKPGKETFELAISRIHPDDLATIRGAGQDVLEIGSVNTRDYRVLRPDGSMAHVEERSEKERDKENRVYRRFGTVQDVTDRVEARSELESAMAEVADLKDQLLDENLYLKREIRTARRATRIIGENAKFNSVIVAAEKVAPTDVTVLILGETGTGKELIAREIHELSDRSESPLISVNCAALSPELIESELFGHEAGAFTGAETQRKGRFELADGGTVFLDEIGDLSIEIQSKILRVLQTEDFERLGGIETLRADVRIITATNRNLKKMIEAGAFRADLYYRINSFPIELPPLRERRDDIPMLANFFVEKYSHRLGKRVESISPDMILRLTQMDWPGNVRQLEGYVQRALISATGPVLNYYDDEMANEQGESFLDRHGNPVAHELDAIQRLHIVGVLNQCGWVIGGENGAADRIGMPASTLRSRMKRLGIQRWT